MKIFLVGKREYEFTPTKGKNAGQEISGYEYIGILESGKPLKFTSQTSDHEVYPGNIEYDKDRAIDVKIDLSLFDDKLKYRENLDLDE